VVLGLVPPTGNQCTSQQGRCGVVDLNKCVTNNERGCVPVSDFIVAY